LVSHTIQNPESQHKPQAMSSQPDLSASETAAPLSFLQNGSEHLTPNDVIRLQRVMGNRALARLISSKNQTSANGIHRSTSGKPAFIQRLMSVKEFKKSTSVNWSRRKKITQIDEALKKIDQTGPDAILLTELQQAIEAWLSTDEADTPRKAGVIALQTEVTAELTKIQEKLATPVPQGDEVPQTRQRRGAMSVNVMGVGKKYKSDFSDFDTKQFRVSGRAPNRTIEEVKRVVMEDGRVVYYAMGLVTGFNGKVPMIAPYPEPISLGDWYPSVTHINGMAVAPKSGILSAEALQESVNSALGTDGDVALGQEAVDVLYTYSAQRGGVVSDVWDCIKGKVGVEDPATEKQMEIMLDAVHNKHRVTVSAHSRGTIKTDNAVMSVHDMLSQEILPEARAEVFDEAVAYWTNNDPGLGIPPESLALITVQRTAGDRAKALMNQYIQLVYAGNAVSYPSSILKPTLYVGGLDPVSMFVGSYTKTFMGAKSVGKTAGHGFVENYVPSVGKEIAKDIKSRPPRR
jgi:hypothetical protein